MTADDGMANYQHEDEGGRGDVGGKGKKQHRREREEGKRQKKRERRRDEEKDSSKHKKKKKKVKKKSRKAEHKEQRSGSNGGRRKRRDDDDDEAGGEDGDRSVDDRDRRKKHRKKRRKASDSPSRATTSSSTDSDSSSPPPSTSRRRKRSRDDSSSSGKRHKRGDEVSAADAADALAFKIAVQGLKKTPSHASDAGGSTDATGGNHTLLELLHQSPAAVAAALGLPQGLIRTSEASNSMTDSYSKKLFGHGGDSNPARAARLRRERTAQRAVERAREMLANRGGGDVG